MAEFHQKFEKWKHGQLHHHTSGVTPYRVDGQYRNHTLTKDDMIRGQMSHETDEQYAVYKAVFDSPELYLVEKSQGNDTLSSPYIPCGPLEEEKHPVTEEEYQKYLAHREYTTGAIHRYVEKHHNEKALEKVQILAQQEYKWEKIKRYYDVICAVDQFSYGTYRANGDSYLKSLQKDLPHFVTRLPFDEFKSKYEHFQQLRKHLFAIRIQHFVRKCIGKQKKIKEHMIYSIYSRPYGKGGCLPGPGMCGVGFTEFQEAINDA